MSKQLSLSAGLSLLAMAAFAVLASPLTAKPAHADAGTKAFASVPALERQHSVLPHFTD